MTFKLFIIALFPFFFVPTYKYVMYIRVNASIKYRTTVNISKFKYAVNIHIYAS